MIFRMFTSIGIGLLFLTAGAATAANNPTKPIEQKYFATGPHSVLTMKTAAGCDSKGDACDIWYPADLGSTPYPIIAWANGSASTPVASSTYTYFLTHLASWGFVVIATEDGTTGVGQTVLDSIAYLKAQNTTSGSIFDGKLNTTHVGVMGHSQGATGAANAMLHGNKSVPGSILTAVTIELPAQEWCSSSINCLATADLTAATQGSIFYVAGSADTLLAPNTQSGAAPPLNSETAYYNATPSAVVKVKAIIIGPNHNDVEGNPNCPAGLFFCTSGVTGYLGYTTAWMMWKLSGATDGEPAFRATTGEIFTETTNWESVLSNVP